MSSDQPFQLGDGRGGRLFFAVEPSAASDALPFQAHTSEQQQPLNLSIAMGQRGAVGSNSLVERLASQPPSQATIVGPPTTTAMEVDGLLRQPPQTLFSSAGLASPLPLSAFGSGSELLSVFQQQPVFQQQQPVMLASQSQVPISSVVQPTPLSLVEALLQQQQQRQQQQQQLQQLGLVQIPISSAWGASLVNAAPSAAGTVFHTIPQLTFAEASTQQQQPLQQQNSGAWLIASPLLSLNSAPAATGNEAASGGRSASLVQVSSPGSAPRLRTQSSGEGRAASSSAGASNAAAAAALGGSGGLSRGGGRAAADGGGHTSLKARNRLEQQRFRERQKESVQELIQVTCPSQDGRAEGP